jgi:ABC-2 type transport system permease protein
VTEPRFILAAAHGLVRRDALLFISYRMRFVAQIVAILFSVGLFYYVSRLVRVAPFESPDEYFGYVIGGLVVLELLTGTMSATPLAVRNELLSGTFERLVVSPFGPRASILSMSVFPILLAVGVGTLTVLLAVVLFGLDLNWGTMPLFWPTALLAAVAFLPLTMLLASAVLVFKQAGSAATFLVTGMALVSGAFFPATLLPGWIEWFSEVQPLTPALALMRHALLGLPVEDGAGAAVARLVLFAAVVLPLGLLLLGNVIDVSRRRGDLTEY